MVLSILVQITMSPHLKRVEQDEQDKGKTLTNLIVAEVTNTIFLGLCCTNSFFFIFSSGSIRNATYTVKGNIQRAQVSTTNASAPPPPPPPLPPPIPPIPVNLLTAAAAPPPPLATHVNLQVPPPPPPPPLAIQVNLQLAPPPPLPPLQVTSPPLPAIQLNPQVPPPADDGNVENVLDIVYR